MKSVLICLCFLIYLEQATTDHFPQEERTHDVHLKLEPPELGKNIQLLEKKVVGCPDGCFRAGSECFRTLPYCTKRWDEALQKCAENGLSLAEPEDFQAVAEYLYSNNTSHLCIYRNEVVYWIGAHTGPNNKTVQWVSGGVIGENAPWVNHRDYEECSQQPMCMVFANEAACNTETFCIGCVPCSNTRKGLNTLCECEPIVISECSPECIHGECVGPNQCECEPGWMGPLCDKQITWPYVGDNCCNLSTTSKCLRKGGECIPRNDSCIGDVYNGPRYCDFNNLKSCKCCVPAECKTLSPCAAMNGTCNTTCEGKSVSGKDFCKDHEFCKCCLPDDCPCGQDFNGGCSGQLPSGNWTEGSCLKTCEVGSTPLYNHSCNKTGGGECNCCAPLSISCPRGCFKSGSECFRRLSNQTTWDEASQACANNDLSLAEPEDFQTLAEYLYNTYTTTIRKPSYWIGVLFGPNNDTVQWASGGELQNPPWYDSTQHRCDYEHLRIGFGAKVHCHTVNWCLYCSPNRGENYGTFPLCECEPIYE